MSEDISCRLLCNGKSSPITWNEDSSQLVMERIQHEYTVHL